MDGSPLPRPLPLLGALLWLGAWLALGGPVPAASPAATPPTRTPAPAHGAWEESRVWKRVERAYADGDSFTLKLGKRQRTFRLYGVDAPETDTREMSRVSDQAAHFGIAPESALALGDEAAAFTRRFLARGCTVRTRWEKAGGQGKDPRHYAIITVGGTNLATELVRHGLARIRGEHLLERNTPGTAAWIREVEAADAEARRAGRGGWDTRRYPPVRRPSPPGTASRPIDVNTATLEELMSLPGIGSTLARRIIDGRPFRTVSDLDRVRGISPATIRALGDRVTAGPPAPR